MPSSRENHALMCGNSTRLGDATVNWVIEILASAGQLLVSRLTGRVPYAAWSQSNSRWIYGAGITKLPFPLLLPATVSATLREWL
jgi:hypothetical protein